MIYITQLIFVKEGKENAFLEFEEYVIPLMEKYSGRILYRIRPDKNNFVSGDEELPYEIHFVTFTSEQGLKEYMKDPKRIEFIHLKEESIKSTLTIKGEKV
ncbi:DUF1330 domain-containing protein [Aquimarina sediminis]|uniref:DUF1330 domain-containing protein n=1 Tax=Aquimarina sediminis TaxID=2070536 RepID=UPI000CA01944|nr:DUF1330 domain-containing protein [Aquimarina sediminis]